MQTAPNAKKVKQNQYLMYKMVLALCITFSLMMIWLNQFEETEDQATSTSFKLVANEFKNAVNLTHVEWLRLARPGAVKLYSHLDNPDDFIQIEMSQNGWPQVRPLNADGCEILWRKLLKQPMKVIHQDIKSKFKDKTCIFRLNKSHILIYQINSGQVSVHNKGVD